MRVSVRLDLVFDTIAGAWSGPGRCPLTAAPSPRGGVPPGPARSRTPASGTAPSPGAWRRPTARCHPRTGVSGDSFARWQIGTHARSEDRTAAGRAPDRRGPRTPCACPWPPPPNRSVSPTPSRTRSEPLQHAHQLRQGVGVKPASDFNPTAARQGHRQTAARAALQHRPAGGLLHLHPAVPGCRAALRLPLPIAGQRGQAQPLLPAELNLAQPAGFVFGYQLPGFRTTPAAPHFDHLCLLVHPFTESRTATRGKMGCSNAYSPGHVGTPSTPQLKARVPAALY